MYATSAALEIALIAKVKASYGIAAAAIYGIPALSPWEAIKSQLNLSSYSQERVDFQQLGVYIDDWASRRASWALQGRRADGTSYTLDRWVAEGQSYAADAMYRAGLAFDSSFFNDAAQQAVLLVKNLPKDLKNAANPMQWPWYFQAAAGVAVLYYVSQIVGNFRGRK